MSTFTGSVSSDTIFLTISADQSGWNQGANIITAVLLEDYIYSSGLTISTNPTNILTEYLLFSLHIPSN